MVSLGHLDQILSIDKEGMTITVEAGARVSEVRRRRRREEEGGGGGRGGGGGD